MTGTLRMLDSSGHTEVQWDTSDPATVAAAMAKFDEAVARGFGAFDTSAPEGGVAIKEFDPKAESVTLVPRMAGG